MADARNPKDTAVPTNTPTVSDMKERVAQPVFKSTVSDNNIITSSNTVAPQLEGAAKFFSKNNSNKKMDLWNVITNVVSLNTNSIQEAVVTNLANSKISVSAQSAYKTLRENIDKISAMNSTAITNIIQENEQSIKASIPKKVIDEISNVVDESSFQKIQASVIQPADNKASPDSIVNEEKKNSLKERATQAITQAIAATAPIETLKNAADLLKKNLEKVPAGDSKNELVKLHKHAEKTITHVEKAYQNVEKLKEDPTIKFSFLRRLWNVYHNACLAHKQAAKTVKLAKQLKDIVLANNDIDPLVLAAVQAVSEKMEAKTPSLQLFSKSLLKGVEALLPLAKLMNDKLDITVAEKTSDKSQKFNIKEYLPKIMQVIDNKEMNNQFNKAIALLNKSGDPVLKEQAKHLGTVLTHSKKSAVHMTKVIAGASDHSFISLGWNLIKMYLEFKKAKKALKSIDQLKVFDSVREIIKNEALDVTSHVADTLKSVAAIVPKPISELITFRINDMQTKAVSLIECADTVVSARVKKAIAESQDEPLKEVTSRSVIINADVSTDPKPVKKTILLTLGSPSAVDKLMNFIKTAFNDCKDKITFKDGHALTQSAPLSLPKTLPKSSIVLAEAVSKYQNTVPSAEPCIIQAAKELIDNWNKKPTETAVVEKSYNALIRSQTQIENIKFSLPLETQKAIGLTFWVDSNNNLGIQMKNIVNLETGNLLFKQMREEMEMQGNSEMLKELGICENNFKVAYEKQPSPEDLRNVVNPYFNEAMQLYNSFKKSELENRLSPLLEMLHQKQDAIHAEVTAKEPLSRASIAKLFAITTLITALENAITLPLRSAENRIAGLVAEARNNPDLTQTRKQIFGFIDQRSSISAQLDKISQYVKPVVAPIATPIAPQPEKPESSVAFRR